MKKIFQLVIVFVVVLTLGMVVRAAVVTPKYPGQLNRFKEGAVIEEEDWNAIEGYLGVSSWCPSSGATTVSCIAQSRISTSTWAVLWNAKTTSDLTEGTNLYWTTARGTANWKTDTNASTTESFILCASGESPKWSGARWECIASATSTHTHTGYESAIAAGTTAQYWRGDKSWQTLNAAAVGDAATSTHVHTGIYEPVLGYIPATSNAVVTWTYVTNKPTTFAPESHATNHLPGASDPLNLSPWMVGAASSITFTADVASYITGSSTIVKTLGATADANIPVFTITPGEIKDSGYSFANVELTANFAADWATRYNASTTLPFTPGITGMVKSAGRVLALASSGTDYDTAAAWNTNANASTTACFAEKVQTLTNKTMDYNSNTFQNFPTYTSYSTALFSADVTASSGMVTISRPQTLTGKTMDYNSNTFTNFPGTGSAYWQYINATTVSPTSTALNVQANSVTSLDSVVSRLADNASMRLRDVTGIPKCNGATASCAAVTSARGFLFDDGSNNLSFQTPTTIQFSATGVSDHTYNGNTTLCTAGEALVFGNFVYKNLWDGRCWKTDANIASTTKNFVGVTVNDGGAAGAQVTIMKLGTIRDDTWAWSASSTEARVYLGETAGAVQANPPGAAGDTGMRPCRIVDADNLDCDMNTSSWVR